MDNKQHTRDLRVAGINWNKKKILYGIRNVVAAEFHCSAHDSINNSPNYKYHHFVHCSFMQTGS